MYEFNEQVPQFTSRNEEKQRKETVSLINMKSLY